MIYRDYSPAIVHSTHPIFRRCIGRIGHSEINKIHRPKDICMTEKSCDLPAGHKQYLIKKRLQFTELVRLRDSIMVCYRNKIKAFGTSSLHDPVHRTTHLTPRLRCAFTIAVATMHMKIAPVPSRRRRDRLIGKRCDPGGLSLDIYASLIDRN